MNHIDPNVERALADHESRCGSEESFATEFEVLQGGGANAKRQLERSVADMFTEKILLANELIFNALNSFEAGQIDSKSHRKIFDAVVQTNEAVARIRMINGLGKEQ